MVTPVKAHSMDEQSGAEAKNPERASEQVDPEGMELFNSAMVTLDTLADLLLQLNETRSRVEEARDEFLTAYQETKEEPKSGPEKEAADMRKQVKSASAAGDRPCCPSRYHSALHYRPVVYSSLGIHERFTHWKRKVDRGTRTSYKRNSLAFRAQR